MKKPTTKKIISFLGDLLVDLLFRSAGPLFPPLLVKIILILVVSCILLAVSRMSAATLNYSHDPLNRLTNAAYSEGSAESYAYDDAGNRISRTMLAATVKVDNTPPSVPANLITNDFTVSQLSIRWNRSSDTGGSGLAGYRVYLNGSPVADTTATNFLLTGLLFDTDYCLTVAAYDRSGNVSSNSVPLCLTTPVFQPPFLSSVAFEGGQFRIGIASGTPGPYDIFTSTNLIDWQLWTNLMLPAPGNLFVDPAASGFDRRFYQLRWSTNAP